MRYNKIRKMDISNGPGVRVSIFMQGCTFNCKECFNPETHDFNGGKEFTDDTINRVLELCDNDNINGLSEEFAVSKDYILYTLSTKIYKFTDNTNQGIK